MSRIKKAVIPVSGYGTRLLPITKSLPKEILPIVDIPAINYLIKEAVDSGIEDILIICNYDKEVIEKYFEPNKKLEERISDNKTLLKKLNSTNLDVKLHFIYEAKPIGNAKTLLLAKKFVGNEPFAVMFADDIIKSKVPALKQLIDIYDEYAFNVIGVQKIDTDLLSNYGIVKFKNFSKKIVSNIVEKPDKKSAPSNYAVIGRYILNPEIFYEIENMNKRGKEYYLTDAIEELMQYQLTHACIIDGDYYDTGSKLGYIKAITSYALDDKEIKEEYSKYLKEIIR